MADGIEVEFIGGPLDGSRRRETAFQGALDQQCPPDGVYSAPIDGRRYYRPYPPELLALFGLGPAPTP